MKAIVAVNKDFIIGDSEGNTPWVCADDMNHFKTLTTNHVVILGRKTYEAIGRPLFARTNIILTKNRDYKVYGTKVVHSVEDLLKIENINSSFVIGGAEIYKLLSPYVTTAYVSLIANTKEVQGLYFNPFETFKNCTFSVSLYTAK